MKKNLVDGVNLPHPNCNKVNTTSQDFGVYPSAKLL